MPTGRGGGVESGVSLATRSIHGESWASQVTGDLAIIPDAKCKPNKLWKESNGGLFDSLQKSTFKHQAKIQLKTIRSRRT
jgi:hypothetical protein